jgi:uncharacterized membrane protein YhhN
MNERVLTLQASASGDRFARTLTSLAVAAALAYLLLLGVRPYPGDVALKTSMCVFLAALAWRERQHLFCLALLFSAAGDAFLGLDGERLFVPGLASFLVTHVLYAALFVRRARVTPASFSATRKLALIVIPAFAVSFAIVLWPHLGGLKGPVALYMIAIVAMALTSLRMPGWLVASGAALFVASDSLIALGKFLWGAPWIGQAIWITYALAQLAIVHGWLRSHRAPAHDRASSTSA